jgi:hypothetical protein
MEVVELSKVKYTHSGDTLKIPLNVNLDINKKDRTIK